MDVSKDLGCISYILLLFSYLSCIYTILSLVYITASKHSDKTSSIIRMRAAQLRPKVLHSLAYHALFGAADAFANEYSFFCLFLTIGFGLPSIYIWRLWNMVLWKGACIPVL
ncbi:hypothetical protein F5Y03DRAFT_365903 [Xylaria venustula]|nr:hypothetical protein F5Y03DRAFT_365903 [Xylaria venustula]